MAVKPPALKQNELRQQQRQPSKTRGDVQDVVRGEVRLIAECEARKACEADGDDEDEEADSTVYLFFIRILSA